MKQCEVVAIVKDRKERSKQATTEAYHLFQKVALVSGLLRTYRPATEDGRKLPQEVQQIQMVVPKVIDKTSKPVIDLFDAVLTQDIGNQLATANVEVEIDGEIALTLDSVPATHLLFLEKQLADLLTMAKSMPTLDATERWTLDSASGFYRSESQQKIRTEKTQRPLVMYPATPEHPAQTQLITEDVAVGTWEETKFSGAVPMDRKELIVRRVVALQEAVVRAREKANQTEVKMAREGEKIWNFVFGD